MATFAGLPSVRDDFRCSLCRQKGAFHCEHDTPYRDQLLGTYDHEKPYLTSSSSQKRSHRTGSHPNNNNSTDHNTTQNINIGKNANTNAGVRYQQGKRSENSFVSNPNTNPNPNGYTKPNEQKKKNKSSCVIL